MIFLKKAQKNNRAKKNITKNIFQFLLLLTITHKISFDLIKS